MSLHVDALAIVGALVVGAIALALAYIGLAFALVYAELAFEWLAKQVFHAAGGHAKPSGEGHPPRPPFDRLWVELRWLASVMRWAQWKIGAVSYVRNPATRPNLARLYELREEHYGGGLE